MARNPNLLHAWVSFMVAAAACGCSSSGSNDSTTPGDNMPDAAVKDAEQADDPDVSNDTHTTNDAPATTDVAHSDTTPPIDASPDSQATDITPSVDLPGYQLVWHDEMDGTSVNTSNWNLRTGARRDAINTASAVSVSGGLLTITTYTKAGVHYTGFIDTSAKYEATYGLFESRIRFHPKPGEWGAFWLQSDTEGNPIGNAATAGAEIDVVEHRAVDKAGNDISGQVASTIHWDGYGADHKSVTSGMLPAPPGPSFTGSWHVFAVLWTDTAYTFYVDGKQIWSTTSGLSKRSEFIRLTCEVADQDWAGNIPSGGYGSQTTSTTQMQVDWVRVWSKP